MIPIKIPQHTCDGDFSPECSACREIVFDPFGFEPEADPS